MRVMINCSANQGAQDTCNFYGDWIGSFECRPCHYVDAGIVKNDGPPGTPETAQSSMHP
jgi:hypothetical protein